MSSPFDVHIYASINCYIVLYTVDVHMSEYLPASREWQEYYNIQNHDPLQSI